MTLKLLFFTAELKFMITTNFFQDDGGFSEIEDDSSSSSDSDASDISVDKNDVDIENDRRKSSTAKVVETKKQV